MNYLEEISGVDKDGSPKSVITIKNKSEDINVIGPIIMIKEESGYVELDMQFDDCEISDIWSIYQIIDQADCDSKLIIIPTKYRGNLHIVAERPLFWALTTTDINVGLNLIKILFEANSCTIFTSQVVKDYGK